MYIDLAENLVKNHIFALTSAVSDFEVQSVDVPYGPQIFRTPGYPVFLALFKLLGLNNPHWIIFTQELIYGLSIFILYRYGRPLFSETVVRVSVIFMLADPGGIAYTKLILSEVLFMPFLIGGILAIGLYLKNFNWRYLSFAGAIMGIAALIRPVIFYFPLVAAVTLIVFAWKNKQRWLHISLMLLSFTVVISPWVIRNYQIFGQYMFSGQTSNMFTHYHLPNIWNTVGVRPYFDSQQYIREIVAEDRNEVEQAIDRPLNAVEFFKLQQKIALTELAKYPLTYFTQWMRGTVKAMFVPFAVEIFLVYHKPDEKIPFLEMFPNTLNAEQTNLFGLQTSGWGSFFSNIIYYLINVDKIYLFTIIFCMINMIFALLAIIPIIKKKDCFLWIVMLANFYFICVAGPMGYARFRMPIDVFWFIQGWIGFIWLLNFSHDKTGKLIKKPKIAYP